MRPMNIINILNEEDHENKPENFSQASKNFDDIFLNGDYITVDGLTAKYTINDGYHMIKIDDMDYSAHSRDGEHWQIANDRTPIDEKDGKPIDIAKYIIELNNK